MSIELVALVTGASSGIGEQTVLELLRRGHRVYGVARRIERMQALAAAGASVFALDVTDDASVCAGVDRIRAETGRLDVLVNNAGYGSYGPVEHVPIDEARRQFEVNVFGMARLTQLVLPLMREQGAGRIINISSIGGKVYAPLGGWYHASKFAVEGLSDALRLEVKPFGIKVILIEPGPIVTEWNEIARTSMVAQAQGTAYAERARRMAGVFARSDRTPTASTPDVVARKIVHAATTDHPRPRYPVGRGAGTIVFSRRVLGDRALDALTSVAFRG